MVKSVNMTVHSPVAQKHLSRYKKKKGVYLIRKKDKVLYVGTSTDIRQTVMRLFHRNGSLSSFNYSLLSFEIISTSLRKPFIESVLKRLFNPPYNKRKPRSMSHPLFYEKKQSQIILDSYLKQTRFEVEGNHQTDTNNQ